VFIAGTAPTALCPEHQGFLGQPEPYPTPPPEEFPEDEEERPPEN